MIYSFFPIFWFFSKLFEMIDQIDHQKIYCRINFFGPNFNWKSISPEKKSVSLIFQGFFGVTLIWIVTYIGATLTKNLFQLDAWKL